MACSLRIPHNRQLFRISFFSTSCLIVLMLMLVSGAELNAQDDDNAGPVVTLPAFQVTEWDAIMIPGKQVYLPALDTPGTSILSLQAETGDLDTFLPNFNISSGYAAGFGDLYSLRGLSNTPYFSEPAVAVYIDDVPMSNAFSISSKLVDLHNTTLFLGPQGACFGKNSEGGVLILESAPFRFKSNGWVEAAWGSDGFFNTRVFSEIPMTEINASLQLSGLYASEDGFVRNLQLGTLPSGSQTRAGRLAFQVNPSPKFEFRWQTFVENHDNGVQPLTPLMGDPYETAVGFDGTTAVDSATHSLRIRYREEDWVLTAVSSYRTWDIGPLSSELILPPPIDSDLSQYDIQRSQEVRIISAPDTDPLISWHAGLYYENTATSGSVLRSIPIPGVGIFDDSEYKVKKETQAIYGGFNYTLNPVMTLQTGLRWEKTEKQFDRTSRVPFPIDSSLDRSDEVVLPTLGLTARIDEQNRIFARTARGYKAGGFSPYTDNPELMPFDAEKLWSHEAGWSWNSPDNSWQGNLNVFYNTIDNYQIERSFTQTDYIVKNTGEVSARGGELEVHRQMGSDLQISLATGYTRAVFENYTDPFTQINYDGRRTPFTPSWDASLGVAYLPDEGFFADLHLIASGPVYFEEANDSLFKSGSFQRVDLSLGWKNENWSASVFLQNAFDERYQEWINAGIYHGTHGNPRTWGMAVRYNFGE